jgi:hypothetical protein
LKIAFFALYKRGGTGFSLRLENCAANSNARSFTCITTAIANGSLFNLRNPLLIPHTSDLHKYIHTYMHACITTAIANGSLFDPAEPAGEYVLDMADPFSQVFT